MDKPNIADKKPVVLEVEAGTYYWCQSGLSKKQPFCDGSHSGTKFTPVEVKVEEKKKIAFCNCKQSNNSYMCDGTHSRL